MTFLVFSSYHYKIHSLVFKLYVASRHWRVITFNTKIFFKFIFLLPNKLHDYFSSANEVYLSTF